MHLISFDVVRFRPVWKRGHRKLCNRSGVHAEEDQVAGGPPGELSGTEELNDLRLLPWRRILESSKFFLQAETEFSVVEGLANTRRLTQCKQPQSRCELSALRTPISDPLP